MSEGRILPKQVDDMRALLEADIFEHGFDAAIDGASRALTWVLDPENATALAQLTQLMERADAERRAEWIARGGDPAHWPAGPLPG